MVLKISKKQWANEILAVLEARYPDKKLSLDFSSAWELLVATQLSAQCTDARVNEVTPEFFKRWPAPHSLIQAEDQEIEEIIRPTGFFHNKRKNLKSCAKKLLEEFDGEVPKSMEQLLTLPGVARKTANVVLYGAFGKNEGLAVDTHVKRIAYRLGLTNSDNPVIIEKDLMEVFPQKSWGSVNHNMVLFGRDLCKAHKPACDICPLSQNCPKRTKPLKENKEKR